MLDKLHEAFHQPDTPAYRAVSSVVWLLILSSVGLFAAEAFVPAEDLETVAWVDRMLLGAFVVEIVLRVISYRPPRLLLFDFPPLKRARIHVTARLRYCLTPLMLVDILTVLALVPALRGLRALRLLRLLRPAKLFRYANPLASMARAFDDDALLFGFAFSMLGGSTIVGGLTLYFVERADNPALNTVGDGLWWALVTLTTVGFGDITPATAVGRVVGGVLMVAGLMVLGLFAGVIGNTLLKGLLTIREEQFRVSQLTNHIVICGYQPGAYQLLDTLSRELGEAERDVVIFAPSERSDEVPARFKWIRGNPTKESELDKTHLVRAYAVAVVGPRSMSPELADAVTVLTTFTIRSYLRRHTENEARRRPLIVLAEILDAENVAHAYAAGADEVIESTRLGFSLLAHAMLMPGTAKILGEVAASGAHSMYVGIFPSNLSPDRPFGRIARSLKRKHGAMLVGLRDPDTGHQTLNPPEDLEVSGSMQLIYLAERAVLPEPTDDGASS